MAKYNVGDKVKYLNLDKKVRYGTITEVTHTDNIYDWNENEEEKPLYKVNTCLYFRFEEEILGICEE